MAMHVVQSLEVVEVDHDGGDGALAPFRIQAQAFQRLLQEAPIVETGERVAQCLIAQTFA